MSKMSNLHANTAPERAEDAERDLAYFKSAIEQSAVELEQVAKIVRAMCGKEFHLVGRIQKIAAKLRGL